MRFVLSILIVTALFFSSFSQSHDEMPYVQQDERVNELLKSFRSDNRSRGIQGFRVQIYTASGNRSKILTERRKAEFDSAFPGVTSYITYDEPYFKLRVGDFRTRMDAERFRRSISSQYIYAAVVVDRINPPRLSLIEEQGIPPLPVAPLPEEEEN